MIDRSIKTGGVLLLASFAMVLAAFVVLIDSDDSSADTVYTVYVSSSGDDNAEGSRAHPFQTISQAMTRTADGNVTIILLDSGSEEDQLYANNERGDVTVNIISEGSVSWSVTYDGCIFTAESWDHEVKITVGNGVALELNQGQINENDKSDKIDIIVSKGAELKVAGASTEWMTNSLVIYGTATFSSEDGIVRFNGDKSILVLGKLIVEGTLEVESELCLSGDGWMSLQTVYVGMTSNFEVPHPWNGHLQLSTANLEYTDIISINNSVLPINNFSLMSLKHTTYYETTYGSVVYEVYPGNGSTFKIADITYNGLSTWYDRTKAITDEKAGDVAKVLNNQMSETYNVAITVGEGFENIKVNGIAAVKLGQYWEVQDQVFIGECTVSFDIIDGYRGTPYMSMTNGTASISDMGSTCYFDVRYVTERTSNTFMLTLGGLSYTDPDYSVYVEVDDGIADVDFDDTYWTADSSTYTFGNVPPGMYTFRVSLKPGCSNLVMTDLVTGERVSDLTITISSASSYEERREYRYRFTSDHPVFGSADVEITVGDGFQSVTLDDDTWIVDGKTHTFSSVGSGTHTIEYVLKSGYTKKVVMIYTDTGEQVSEISTDSSGTYRISLSGPAPIGEDTDDEAVEEESSEKSDDSLAVAFAACAVAAMMVVLAFWVSGSRRS